MENSDYIALASVFIALLAFVVAIWQGVTNRRHNILSVKPRFHIEKSYIDGIHYTLESQGLGPGIIKCFTILVNGQEYTNPQADPWPEIFRRINVTKANYDFHIPAIGSTHVPNQTRQLLSVTFVDKDNQARNQQIVEAIDQAINFRIEFCSLYEEEVFIYMGDN